MENLTEFLHGESPTKRHKQRATLIQCLAVASPSPCAERAIAQWTDMKWEYKTHGNAERRRVVLFTANGFKN
jgi:hypothetical protein